MPSHSGVSPSESKVDEARYSQAVLKMAGELNAMKRTMEERFEKLETMLHTLVGNQGGDAQKARPSSSMGQHAGMVSESSGGPVMQPPRVRLSTKLAKKYGGEFGNNDTHDLNTEFEQAFAADFSELNEQLDGLRQVRLHPTKGGGHVFSSMHTRVCAGPGG